MTKENNVTNEPVIKLLKNMSIVALITVLVYSLFSLNFRIFPFILFKAILLFSISVVSFILMMILKKRNEV